MSKYIDADALKKKIKENPWLRLSPHDSDIIMMIINDEMPAVDVEPVIHGKWEYADWPLKSSNRFCSVCGCGEKIYVHNKDDFKYCRQCGAKMDGGSECDHGGA